MEGGLDRSDAELAGMIPRAIYTIFEALNDENIANDYKVTVSHLEIYNEQLRDLLANDPVAELQLLQQPQLLRVRHHPSPGYEQAARVCTIWVETPIEAADDGT